MINYKQIQAEFRGLIGIRPSYNSTTSFIDKDLQESSSGIYVNDLHDLFTIENFDSIIQSPKELATIQAYSNSATYKINSIVKESNDVFVSIVDDNIGNPTSDFTKWQKTTLLSAWLRQKYDYAVNQVIQKFFSFKKDLNQAKEVLQRVTVFYSYGGEMITKSGSFVGYRINVKSPMLANFIKRIGIQFTKSSNVRIYLFHSSQEEAIATKEVAYTNQGRFQWFDTDFVLKKTSKNYEDGYFTIGYFESELAADNSAINAKVDLGINYNCGSCNYRNISLYDLWNKFFDIEPIQIQAQFLGGLVQSWHHDNAIVYDTRNWGLNMVFSVECDFTNILIQNKDVFISALSEQLKIVFLNSIANTQRHNQEAVEASNKANYWLKEGGYFKVLQKAIENLSFDLSDLDKNCLPPEPLKDYIRHDTVW